MRRQRGIVLLMFVVVLAAIGSVFVLSASSLQAQQASNRVDAERAAYLEETGRAVRGWYIANLAAIDTSAAPPAEVAILTGAALSFYLLRFLLVKLHLNRWKVLSILHHLGHANPWELSPLGRLLHTNCIIYHK